MSKTVMPYLRVNLYFTAFAALLGVIYLLSRIGLPGEWDPLGMVAGAVGLTAIVLLGPSWMPGLSAVPDGKTGAAMNLYSWLILGGLAVLSYLPVPLGMVLSLGGGALTALGLYKLRPGWRFGRVIGFILLAVLFAAIVINRPTPPFSFEQALAGTLFPDTYFHFSITQMLRWQGAPSIGIDGVPWYNYHFGSNYLIARLTALMGGEVPVAYPALLHLLFLPLLLRSMVLVVADKASLRHRVGSWLIPLPLFAVIAHVSMTNDLVFISPSYLLSLSAMLALLPAGLWAAEGNDKPAPLAVWLALALMLAVVTAIKTSTGLLILLALLFLLFRGPQAWRQRLLWALMLIAVFAVVFSRFAPLGDFGVTLSIEPFRYYFNDEVKVRHQPFFFVIYAIFSIAYLAARLAEESAFSWPGFKAALRERRMVDAEMIGLLTVAGYGPGAIFYASGHLIWVYFYDFPAWLALPLLCGWLLRQRHEGKLLPVLRQFPVAAVLLLLLTAPLLHVLGPYLMKRGGRHLAEIIEINQVLQGEIPAKRHELSKRIKNAFSFIQQPARLARLLTAEKNLPPAKLAAIKEVVALRHEHGREIAVYIPLENTEYWTGGCRTDAMFIPAMAGVPLINGMPPLGCRKKSTYGYAPFAPRETNDALDEASVCRRARAKGFSVVYRMNSLSTLAQNRLYHCSKE